MIKILIINGPNLNMLGVRNKEFYGELSLEEINNLLQEKAKTLNINLFFYQSNIEGNIIDKIHQCIDNYDGVIINAGAYSHYSLAIRDAIETVAIPFIEVHMSNIHSREDFRHHSVLSAVCKGQISGFGHDSYVLALYAMTQLLKK